MEVQKAIDILSSQVVELGNQNVLMQKDLNALRQELEVMKKEKGKLLNLKKEGLD